MGDMYRVSRYPRSGTHIVRSSKKMPKTIKGLCGRKVGQEIFFLTAKVPTRDEQFDESICPSCFGLYANEFLMEREPKRKDLIELMTIAKDYVENGELCEWNGKLPSNTLAQLIETLETRLEVKV